MINTEIIELDARGLRRFAISTSLAIWVIFGGLLPWLFEFDYPKWPWVVLAVAIIWGLVAPKSLRPVYIGWMKFAFALSKITTPIILGLIFFVVFLPVALIMKVIGRDPMNRNIDPSATTYKKTSEAISADNLERPF